ncbi:MAG: hypothetical protein KF718_23195 [Polyangiaceae bacterium]|nr:hypothetical protein [Polyangiaceae bacterium]
MGERSKWLGLLALGALGCGSDADAPAAGGQGGAAAASGSGGASGSPSGGAAGSAASGGAAGSGGSSGSGGSGGVGGGGGAGGSSGSGGSGGTSAPLYVVSIDHDASPSLLLKIDVQSGAGKIACTLPSGVDAVNYPSTTFTRNGLLFASNHEDSRLDRIDPCSCSVTPVGPTGYQSIPGITANKTEGLFGIETVSDILIDLNPATGAGTQVGLLGVDFTTGGATWSDALNIGQGGLYAINGATNQLYTLNPSSGAATALVAISGVTFGTVGVELHPSSGVLYACTNDAVLYSIDGLTGQATALGNGMGHVGACNNLAAPWKPVPCLDAL